MPSLLEVQHAVADGVLSGDFTIARAFVVSDTIAAGDRLGIYRNTARVGVTEALRQSFPAVDALTGRDFFDMAAARLFHANPPTSACLDDYGDVFAAFLDAMPETLGVPYLGDVARFEWALGRAAMAPDAPMRDASELAAIPVERHATLRLRAHPSVRLLALAFPADRITEAVLSGDDAAMNAIDLSDGPIHLAINRGRSGLQAERIDAPTHEFLRNLFAGRTMIELLDRDRPDPVATIAAQFLAGRIATIATGVGAREPECRT